MWFHKKYSRDFFKLKMNGTNNKKMYESKFLTGKSKYVIKVVDQ